MAKRWYLLDDENDLMSDYATEEIESIMNSSSAIDVELYNYDLSECQQIRAVIKGRVKDTKLNSLARQAIVPIGTFKAGMYIKYNGRFWLIVGLVDDNGVYEKGVMVLCMYYLTWINSEGEIVQRWANITSASQYNNGETGMTYYFVRSDQLLVILPDDDESMSLSVDMRFIIDRRTSLYEENFDDDVTVSTGNPLVCYKLTRSDSVLYNYQDSGHYEFLATECEQGENDGYYVVDGKGYWLCDIPVVDEELTSLQRATIVYDEPTIYNSFEGTVFDAKFYNSKGEEDTEAVARWYVNCDFADYVGKLNVTHTGNSICISTNDKSLVNKSFELSLIADGYERNTIKVTIKAFF